MLSGDYFTYSIKATQSGGSPYCRCCSPSVPQDEDISHILVACEMYEDIRKRFFPHFKSLCSLSASKIDFEDICKEANILTQFILDPSSFNLKARMNISDLILSKFFKISRDYCNAIHTKRLKIIKSKEETKSERHPYV